MARYHPTQHGPMAPNTRSRPKTPRAQEPRRSPLAGRNWQGPADHSGEAAQRLQQRNRSRQPQRQSKRDRRRQMENWPVPPSFLPEEYSSTAPVPASFPPPAEVDKDFRPPAWAAHVPSSPTPVPTAAVPPSTGPTIGQTNPQAMPRAVYTDPSIEAQVQELHSEEVVKILSETLEAGPEINWETELGLPSIEELERERKEILQRRQQEGSEALRALEQEARSQEVERIRSSHIEIPDLDLKTREGNSYLHVSRLNKRYGRKIAVEDISISLRQGEVVGLLGPNGAGKTTCFYMIAGFVHPTRGQVLLDEKDISRWPMFKRARQGISYLPQEASIFRSLTVEQNLLAILEYRRDMNRKARREMAEFLMERLGVLRLGKQKASTLSGGERRRVEVARALTLEPRFLLLDEPFAGIDPIAVSDIKGIIRALAQSNIGILITDHNVRDTLDITDRSYIVNLGEILVSGSRAELIASKAAREVYLGADFG